MSYCYHAACQVSRTYSSLIIEPVSPWTNSSPFPHPQTLAVPIVLCVYEFNFLRFQISDIMQYVSFCIRLILLSVMSSRLIHVVTNGRISFFLKAEQHPIVCTEHIFFIYLSTEELRLLPYLGYWNNAAINMRVHISLQDSDFIQIGHTPRSGIAALHGSSIFKFVRNQPLYCLPKWLPQFTFPPTVYKGSLFSTLSVTPIFCLFDNSHSNRCEVLSHCGFDLYFSHDQ